MTELLGENIFSWVDLLTKSLQQMFCLRYGFLKIFIQFAHKYVYIGVIAHCDLPTTFLRTCN